MWVNPQVIYASFGVKYPNHGNFREVTVALKRFSSFLQVFWRVLVVIDRVPGGLKYVVSGILTPAVSVLSS
jgi:hypothetical protein